jgi:hypothetical protein
LQDAVIRQSEKGLTITAVFLNEDSSPYDLTNKKVIFNEHKESDKYVVDTNVQITDARNGAISYTLHSQCYAATGEAWFEIADASGTVVDSTQNFNLKVKDAANASIYNTNYITQLDALRDQMQQLVDGADGQLKQQLQTTQNQLNQKLTDIGNAYQTAEQGRANAYKQAEANRDNDWSQDKQRIDNEWNQDKDRINGEWNSQKQAIQNTANSQQSSISSQWSQLKSNADSQLATIKSNINALQATIDDINKNKVPGFNSSLQSAQDKLDKILASLGNFVVSANDVNSISSDKVAEIAGNLIDPNLNNWTKDTEAQQAFKTINFSGTTNEISYQGVSGTEMLYTKINPELYKHYKVRFRFTPKSDIRDLSNGYTGTIGFCVYRTVPAPNGNWGAEQGNDNLTTQIKRIAINQDKFYEFGFYSDNAQELYIGFNFNDVCNNRPYNFEISSISVVNIDNTIQNLVDSSYPMKIGAAGDDLFLYKNNHEIRIYDNISDVKNKPSGASNWFIAVIDTVRNFWGNIKVFCPGVGSWQIDLTAGNWNSWFTLFDSRTAYSKSEIDKSFVKSVQGVKPDGNGNINLPNQNVAFSFDSSTGEPVMRMTPYLNYWPVDQVAIKDVLKNQLPNKYAGKNIVNISNPMFYSTKSVDDFTAMGSPNKTQTLTVYRSDFNANDDGKPGLANYSQGLIFGAWTERGVLSISNVDHKARIAGGTYPGEENGWQVWSEDIAWKSDFANYYSKSEIDGTINTLKKRCEALETQIAVLQGQLSNLLSVINVSDGSLNVSGNLIVKNGNIQNYWGGVDQYVAYTPAGVKRGYFGVWDNGTFQARGNS